MFSCHGIFPDHLVSTKLPNAKFLKFGVAKTVPSDGQTSDPNLKKKCEILACFIQLTHPSNRTKQTFKKIFSRFVFFYNGFVLYAARDGQQQRKKLVCLSREP